MCFSLPFTPLHPLPLALFLPALFLFPSHPLSFVATPSPFIFYSVPFSFPVVIISLSPFLVLSFLLSLSGSLAPTLFLSFYPIFSLFYLSIYPFPLGSNFFFLAPLTRFSLLSSLISSIYPLFTIFSLSHALFLPSPSPCPRMPRARATRPVAK